MAWASDSYSAAQRLRTGDRRVVREALLAQRQRTVQLVHAYRAALGPGLAVPEDAGLNPPLWEWGHIAWFHEWWVVRNRQLQLGAGCDPDHARPAPSLPGADAWYDSSRVPHATRWSLPLPGLEATLAWLDSTLAATLDRLEALPGDAGHEALYFLRLACLHEAMHAEAACYMARSLGFEVPVTPLPEAADAAPLVVPARVVRIGDPGEGFAFDNEQGAHEVALDTFEIDAQPVRWCEFARFVQAGGYDTERWWTPEGWRWRMQSRAEPPAIGAPGQPAVHLNCHEAQAWCRWAGRRLPTEAEWECAALHAPGFRWGPVWEWSASAFQPYPGFRPHPYRDYSAPWFGSRQVLRGACMATSPELAHPRYRNFFEPHRRDVFAGFRSCAGPVPATRV